jgi:hypothetical protein
MEQDAFRNHVISYLTKLEVEIQALHLALLHADEPLVTDEQMQSFRAQAGGKADQVGDLIRREFGLPPSHDQLP